MKKIEKVIGLIISRSELWRILAELEKSSNFTIIETPDYSIVETKISNRTKGFENVTDDFENRLTNQKLLNNQETEFLRVQAAH